MSLESKLSKTAKFVGTGVAGIATCMAIGYGLGEVLQGTFVDTGIQYAFNTFKVEYHNLTKFTTFAGFGTGLKMTAFLEFYNIYPKVKKAFKYVYNKSKSFIKNTYDTIEDKIGHQKEKIKTEMKKPKKERLKTLGSYFLSAGIGLGLGKLVGEGFEHVSYTNYAFTYLFNNFADLHFAELGDLFTLLGTVWGFRMKPQLYQLYTYLAKKGKYAPKKEEKIPHSVKEEGIDLIGDTCKNFKKELSL